MRPFSTSRGGRRGNVTVIVVAFLGLFLVLGLTFVFYAIAEADQSKVYRDAANGGQTGVSPTTHDGAPPEPESIFGKALGDIIYGPPEGLPGAFNSLRGHDLARLIYGYNPADPGGATQPFNGVGHVPAYTVHPNFDRANAGGQPPVPPFVVNWTWHVPLSPAGGGRDPRFLLMYDRDNNWGRSPKNPAANQNTPGSPTYRYYAPNANYTYPDLNNMFLAALDPTTGQVLVPSYFRRYLMDDGTGSNVPPSAHPARRSIPAANLNRDPAIGYDPVTGISEVRSFPSNSPAGIADPDPWTNYSGRFLTLRPRPVDHMIPVGNTWISRFPYPKQNPDGVTYGDVENIEGKPGGRQYDAFWMDLDLPVRRWQGKNYKPLFAFTIVDLDNRVNVNTAGNFFPLPDDSTAGTPGLGQQPPAAVRAVVPPQYGHYSNQGIGSWEVNLARVMRSFYRLPNGTPVVASALMPGNPANAQWDSNDAAYLSLPTLAWKTAGDPPPPTEWKVVGVDGHNRYANDGTPNKKFFVYPNEPLIPPGNRPSPGSGAPYSSLVDYDGLPLDIRYGVAFVNAPRWADPSDGRRTSMVFGPPFQNAAAPNNAQPNPVSRYGNGLYITDAGGNLQYSERDNHPSMYDPYWVKSRRSSNPGNLDRTYGVEEMRFLNEKFNYVRFDASELAKRAPRSLGASNVQGAPNPRFLVTTLSSDLNLPGASPWLGAPIGIPSPSYNPNQPGHYPTWGVQAFVPTPADGNPATLPQAGADHDQSYRARLVSQLGPVDINRKLTDYRTVASMPLGPNNVGNYLRARQDRQDLARDIFDRLRYVTTGDVAITAAPGTPKYHALRYLAQLAVNIVDFIDNDDLNTPFNWNPAGAPTTPNNPYGNSWVYGFERPRLVMNETFTRLENAPGDMGAPDPNGGMNRVPQFPFLTLRCWLELHNPLTPGSPGEQTYDPTGDAVALDPNHGGYRTNLEEQVHTDPTNLNSPANAQTAYRILIYQHPHGVQQQPGTALGMANPDNVTGTPQLPPVPPQPAGWPKVVDFTTVGGTVNTGQAGKTIHPNVGASNQNQGATTKTFYLIGPSTDSPDAGGMMMGEGGNQAAQLPDGSLTADLTHRELSVQMLHAPTMPGQQPDVDQTGHPRWVPMFVLQRLANPYIPYQGQANSPQPGNDPNNPWVTIDWIDPDTRQRPILPSDMESVCDHIQYLPDASRDQNSQPGMNSMYSWGRRQPYDGRIFWTVNQQQQQVQQQQLRDRYRQVGGNMGVMQLGGQTLGKVNGRNGNWPASATKGPYANIDESPGTLTGNGQETLQVPFLPLNHLDRVLISPIELLHVAACKPHELTHLFFMAQAGDGLNPARRRVAYTANWLDDPDRDNGIGVGPGGQSTFLFRALDFLRPGGSFTEGIPLGGRVPGKLNLNTMFAQNGTPGQFNAVTDPNAANRFDQLRVDQGWFSFAMGRQSAFNGTDRPYKGLATEVISAGGMNPGPISNGNNSQDRTLARMGGLWRSGPNDEDFDPTAAQASGGGAMDKYELMSKSLQQFTTRSNAFAVYATVGYFEVMNEGPYDEVNRPILGKEIGTDEGTTTRHRFFAVIDRTNLMLEQRAAPAPLNVMPTGRQGTPPAYFEYHPNVPFPFGNTPIVPDPDLFPTGAMQGAQSVECRIPALRQVLGPPPNYPNPPGKTIQLHGTYDGIPWEMIDLTSPATPAPPRSIAVFDIGPRAELVAIRFPLDGPALDPITGTARIILQPLNPTGTFQFRHSRGAPIRLVNPDPRSDNGYFQLPPLPAAGMLFFPTTLPGNPGPQAGFQFRAPRYAPVIRYAEQTQ